MLRPSPNHATLWLHNGDDDDDDDDDDEDDDDEDDDDDDDIKMKATIRGMFTTTS